MSVKVFARRRPKFGSIASPLGMIELDASTREDHGVHNRITDHPVAFGALITDHILTLPDQVTIEGVVTATPDDVGDIPSFSNTRHHRAWQRFVELARSKIPFDVVTTLAVYTNMVVADLDTTRTAADGKSLLISVSCRKIEVSSVDVAQELADQALEAGLAEVDLGVQGTGVL